MISSKHLQQCNPHWLDCFALVLLWIAKHLFGIFGTKICANIDWNQKQSKHRRALSNSFYQEFCSRFRMCTSSCDTWRQIIDLPVEIATVIHCVHFDNVQCDIESTELAFERVISKWKKTDNKISIIDGHYWNYFSHSWYSSIWVNWVVSYPSECPYQVNGIWNSSLK